MASAKTVTVYLNGKEQTLTKAFSNVMLFPTLKQFIGEDNYTVVIKDEDGAVVTVEDMEDADGGSYTIDLTSPPAGKTL
ncbi:unnamed protein product [Polarella glacialis]|uniref:Uncharacterized protein n=1 Tax=Polarella glacialis TaxID=89957 RepID=A0A813HQ46_POLGL|nr:unnamed protein product [Polarella glacialis]CAE8678866.1 unnamed protein product [Polarella glacialis]